MGGKEMVKHRVAVIGLGLASEPHLRSLAELGDRVEVACAVTRSEGRARELSPRFAFPVGTGLERVIEDDSIVAALVLTPPNSHLELVRRLAAAGKHMLLEKPIELDLARAKAVVETCEAHNAILGIVLQSRFRPGAAALARRMHGGELGALVNASVSVRWWRPQAYYDDPGRGTYARDGGGVLITQAIHALDLFVSLTGEPAEVNAIATTTASHRMECEDLAVGVLRFEDGAVGSVDATTACYPGFPERIELVGTLATAVYSGGLLEVFYQDGRIEREGTAEATGAGASVMGFSHHAHKALIADFLDAIENRREPRCSGSSVLRVHRLIAALTESSRRGCAIRLAELA
jgi:UDP-N-acetyl-2-amino-2-deoxyglucuronate dehydrogenase